MEGLVNSLLVLIGSLPLYNHTSAVPMQLTHKQSGLPFAILIGNEDKLTIHLRDPEVQRAFSSTALITPTGLSQPFPSTWTWDHLTCAVFTRLHRWDKESITRNLKELAMQAERREGLLVLHLEFESDLRYLNIELEPQYVMKL